MCKQLGKGWIASSLTPPNGRIIVPQIMPTSVSMTAGKNTADAAAHGQVFP
jgi:hypothetical protein